MPHSSPHSLSLRFRRTGVRGYALAGVAVAFTGLLIRVLRSFGLDVPDSVLLLPVAVGFLYGGIGPGLLTLAAAALISRDLVVVILGALLGLACESFRRRALVSGSSAAGSTQPGEAAGRYPAATSSAKDRGPFSRDIVALPVKEEVTTEATWRFHHDQPLDITLPEDEQIEHFYIYSVLAECNDAFARMYGFRTAADVVGTRLVVFLPPSNTANVEYLRSFIRSGYRLEDAGSEEIDRYGRAKYFVNNLVGIFERGRLVGAWGTQRDVTGSRQDFPQEYRSRVHSTKSPSQ